MKTIPLTQGKETVVDNEDYEELGKYKWYALRGKRGWYAARRNSPGLYPTIVLMHRWMLNAPDDMEVDHINRDPLDNRRENIRLATKSQNSANRRRYDQDGKEKLTRGITYIRGKWVASIKVNKASFYLGRFLEKEDAMRRYNEEAVKHFGDYAKLNVF